MSDFKEFLIQVGARVRQLRQALGLSIEAAAHRSEIHPSFWSQVERAAKLPSLKSIHKMAKGLRVTPSEIIGVEQEPGPAVPREVSALFADRSARERTRLLAVLREILGFWSDADTHAPPSRARRPSRR